MMYFLVSAIEWDTDGKKVDLPETIGVLMDEDHFGEGIEDDILDQILDNLECSVNSCFIEQIDETDLPPVDFCFTLL